MGEQKGFSLIELLLVVAVMLIIAGIAIPNFLRAKMSANESSAVASMHNIDTAQVSYASTFPSLGFAPDLNTLGPGTSGSTDATSANALLLDNVLGCPTGVGTATCIKSGYAFAITSGSGTPPMNSYTSNANPTSYNSTGTRYFYSDNSAVIRFNTAAIATVDDTPIQ
jgi:type IV pilus assembly protein PilA